MYNSHLEDCTDAELGNLLQRLTGQTSMEVSSPRILVTDEIVPHPTSRMLQFDRVVDTRFLGRFDRFLPRYVSWKREYGFPSRDLAIELEESLRGCLAVTMALDADDVSISRSNCTATYAIECASKAATCVREDLFIQTYRAAAKKSAKKDDTSSASGDAIREVTASLRNSNVYASVHSAASIIFAAIGDLSDVIGEGLAWMDRMGKGLPHNRQPLLSLSPLLSTPSSAGGSATASASTSSSGSPSPATTSSTSPAGVTAAPPPSPNSLNEPYTASLFAFDRRRCDAVCASLEAVGLTPIPHLVARMVQNIRTASLARLPTQRARIYAEAFLLIHAHTADLVEATRKRRAAAHAADTAAGVLRVAGTPTDFDFVLRGVSDDAGCSRPTRAYEEEWEAVGGDARRRQAPSKGALSSQRGALEASEGAHGAAVGDGSGGAAAPNSGPFFPLLTHVSLQMYIESCVGEPLRLYADSYLQFCAYLNGRDKADGACPTALFHALVLFFATRGDTTHVLSASTSALSVPAWPLVGRRTVGLLADVYGQLGLTQALTGLQEVVTVRERNPPLLFHYYQCIIRARAMLARPTFLEDVGPLVESNTAYVEQLSPEKKAQPASQMPWQAMQQWLLRSGSSGVAQWVLKGLLEDGNVTGGMRQSNILSLFVSASAQFGDAGLLDLIPAILYADAQLGSFDRHGLRARVGKGQGSEMAVAFVDGVQPASDAAFVLQVADSVGRSAEAYTFSPFGDAVMTALQKGVLVPPTRRDRNSGQPVAPTPLFSVSLLWAMVRVVVDGGFDVHDWRVQLLLLLARRLTGTFESTVDSKLRFFGLRKEMEAYVCNMHDVTVDRSRSAFDSLRGWPNLFPKHGLRTANNHAVAHLPRLQTTALVDVERAKVAAALAPRVMPFGLSTLSVTGMAAVDAARRVAVWRDVVADTVSSAAARRADPMMAPRLPPAELAVAGYVKEIAKDPSTHPYAVNGRAVEGFHDRVAPLTVPFRGPRRGLRVAGPGGFPVLRRFVRACM